MTQFCYQQDNLASLILWLVIFIFWAVICLICYISDKKDDPTLNFWTVNFPRKDKFDLFWHCFMLLFVGWGLFRLICTFIWGFQ